MIFLQCNLTRSSCRWCASSPYISYAGPTCRPSLPVPSTWHLGFPTWRPSLFAPTVTLSQLEPIRLRWTLPVTDLEVVAYTLDNLWEVINTNIASFECLTRGSFIASWKFLVFLIAIGFQNLYWYVLGTHVACLHLSLRPSILWQRLYITVISFLRIQLILDTEIMSAVEPFFFDSLDSFLFKASSRSIFCAPQHGTFLFNMLLMLRVLRAV